MLGIPCFSANKFFLHNEAQSLHTLLHWRFLCLFQNGAEHTDKVEETTEEEHKNGEGELMRSATIVF